MKLQRISLAGSAVVLVAASAVAGGAWPRERVVTVTGVGRCYNYSHSLGLWSILPREDRPGRLLVRDGDILAVGRTSDADKAGRVILLPYRDADGQALALAYDGKRLTLAGKTVALQLTAEDGAWEWLKQPAPEAMARLRCVVIGGKLSADQMGALKSLAAHRPDLDLMLDNGAPVDEALRLFEPRRLLLPDGKLTAEQQRLVAKMPELETLWLKAEQTRDLDFLAFLPKLQRLLVSGWKPARADLFPWGCRRLRALTLTDAGLRSFAPIEHLTELRELRVMGCDELTDLQALRSLSRLEVLSLSLDKEVEDYAPVARLPRLRHLALAAPIEQPVFDAFVGGLPQLESFDLLGCKNVKKLAALGEMRGLRHLALLTASDDLEPVLAMKHLRVLALPFEACKDPKTVAAVRRALPETALTEAHVCLGSGWLLLLLPALALGWLLWWRRRAGERHA